MNHFGESDGVVLADLVVWAWQILAGWPTFPYTVRLYLRTMKAVLTRKIAKLENTYDNNLQKLGRCDKKVFSPGYMVAGILTKSAGR
jgi:hypothetical protein